MSYLEQHRLTIHTLSPVFIGSGICLTKKDYIFIPQTKQILFVDLHKLFTLLEKKNLSQAYESFVMGREKDLYGWLMSKRLTQDEVWSIASYTVHAGNAMDTTSGTNLTGIQLFLKDSYNLPYIPGSSVKGAIHTAILASMAEHKDYSDQMDALQAKLAEKNKKKILDFEAEQVETEWLHTLYLQDKRGIAVPRSNAVRSIMKGIQISDSMPLPQDSLTLCSKMDFETNGGYKNINTVRECIRPNVAVQHTLTLDTTILSAAKIDISVILNAVCNFYKIQNQYFISKFQQIKQMDHSKSNGCELFLGGGTGYVSKTILYPMLKDKALPFTAQLMQRQFPNHFHTKDVDKGVSPHVLKCTKYNGKIYQMGRCEVNIL